MAKMHLGARVPNEGARRLAWWIGREFLGSVKLAAFRLKLSTTTVERMLQGEVVPGSELAEPLARVAGVAPRLWRREAEGGWFDAPLIDRELLAA